MSIRTGRAGIPLICVVAMLLVGAAPAAVEADPNEVLQAGPLVASAVHARHTIWRAHVTRHAESPLSAIASRPALLVPLYVSFGALQALDAHSTLTAIDRGFREMNPIISPTAGSPGALIAAKAAASVATIAGAEVLWRRNRLAAVITMIAINAGYAAVVAHNYHSLSRVR